MMSLDVFWKHAYPFLYIRGRWTFLTMGGIYQRGGGRARFESWRGSEASLANLPIFQTSASTVAPAACGSMWRQDVATPSGAIRLRGRHHLGKRCHRYRGEDIPEAGRLLD